MSEWKAGGEMSSAPESREETKVKGAARPHSKFLPIPKFTNHPQPYWHSVMLCTKTGLVDVYSI